MRTDDKVDAAARVLRLLYMQQLRQLQTGIDDAIVAVQVGQRWPSVLCGRSLAQLTGAGLQEFTANPRTNTR